MNKEPILSVNEHAANVADQESFVRREVHEVYLKEKNIETVVQTTEYKTTKPAKPAVEVKTKATPTEIKTEIKTKATNPLPEFVAEIYQAVEISADTPLTEMYIRDVVDEVSPHEASEVTKDILENVNNQEILPHDLIVSYDEALDPEELAINYASLEADQELSELYDTQYDLSTDVDEAWAYPPMLEATQTLGNDVLVKQLDAQLETLEPVDAETARTLIESIIDSARELSRLQETGRSDVEMLESELKELYKQLQECLGIESSEYSVEYFLHAIGKVEVGKHALEHNEHYQEQGTHEKKLSNSSLVKALVHMMKQEVSFPNLLGKLALRLDLSNRLVIPLAVAV